MKTLADQEARSRIGHDLATTLIVEAAAGTGKTTELVGRILSLLRGGASLSRIVAVTFTEKAAGEMKLRLRTEIEKARAATPSSPEDAARFEAALSELEETRIGTIHGFCADLLRERAVEAKVDPEFEMAAEEEKERLYGECFERWFQKELAAPSEGVRRVLRRRSRDRDSHGPRDTLRRAGSDLIEQRDFDTPWRRDPFDRQGSIDAILERLGTLASYVAKADDANDYLVQNLQHVRRFMSEVRAKEAVRAGSDDLVAMHRSRDYDGVEAELRELLRGKVGKTWNWKGNSRGFRSGTVRKEALDLRDRLREDIALLTDAMDADLAACLHRELRPLVSEFEDLKRRKGKLDFLDLLLLTRNLLAENRAVRAELQQRFSHLLVDEFQDTDPLQADILMLLAADDPDECDPYAVRPLPGKLFVVGDPKQSIYRFRRADVALYEATKRRLLTKGAELIHLTTSFRSVPAIQSMVNGAFAPLMQGGADGSQAEYVALTPFRDEPSARPSIVALPVPRPYSDWGKIVKFKIEDSIPDAVAAFVDYLIKKSGFTITEREDPTKNVSIQARHVCLLFKRFQQFGQDVTRPYVRALEARRVPHVLVGGRSFHDREEVVATRNALSAIEWPEDEFSVYGTLRGPFFAVSDDALLAYRYPEGKLFPSRRLDPLRPATEGLNELTTEVAGALAILGRLHRGRNRRPIADTLTRLLEATRAHAGVAIWPTGEQALGNLLRVLDLARRFEAAGATSFRSFVSRLEDEAERGGAAEAPVVEEGTDGVRIMTVHKAKGLEFPVVILVDPTAPAAPQKPSRYVDAEKKLWVMPLAGCTPIELLEKRDEVLRHDAAESVRVAYVAATRAREMLVIPVVGDATAGEEAASGWLDVLHPVLFPRAHERRSAELAPDCPPFGQDSVFERPESAHRDMHGSVQPGAHRPEIGAHRVVFWDPGALELDKQDEVGLRQQRILAADEGETAATEGERLYTEWQQRRSMLLERGARPSRRIATVTEMKRDANGKTVVERAPEQVAPAPKAPSQSSPPPSPSASSPPQSLQSSPPPSPSASSPPPPSASGVPTKVSVAARKKEASRDKSPSMPLFAFMAEGPAASPEPPAVAPDARSVEVSSAPTPVAPEAPPVASGVSAAVMATPAPSSVASSDWHSDRATPSAPTIEVRLESTSATRAQRPHGKRFGILVHAILSTLDWNAGLGETKSAARSAGRLLGATAEEVDAAGVAVTAALGHPLLEQARRASACRRESPISLRTADGTWIEGILDLAFRDVENGVATWTVVDFKTDVEIKGRRDDYERQVRVYAEAVAGATGEQVRCVLLSV